MWVGEYNWKNYGNERETYARALKDFLSGRSNEGEVDELEVCDIYISRWLLYRFVKVNKYRE